MSAREERMAAAVAGVVEAARVARGAATVVVLDDGSPEAALALRWLVGAERVGIGYPGMEPLLHAAGPRPVEALRFRARLIPDSIVAHPANKTALLLGGAPPPETLLPLGDVWASEVQELADGWSAPPAVVGLAEAAGGIHLLDAALRRWLEGRDPSGLGTLPTPVAEEVRRCFIAGRADRVHPRIVPKLTARTVGVDLFE